MGNREEENLTSEGDFAGSGGEIWRGMGAISSRVKIVGGRRSSLRFKAKREKGTERYRDPRKKQSFSIAWGVFPPLSQWPFLLQKVEIRHDYFPIELNWALPTCKTIRTRKLSNHCQKFHRPISGNIPPRLTDGSDYASSASFDERSWWVFGWFDSSSLQMVRERQELLPICMLSPILIRIMGIVQRERRGGSSCCGRRNPISEWKFRERESWGFRTLFATGRNGFRREMGESSWLDGIIWKKRIEEGERRKEQNQSGHFLASLLKMID